MVTAQDTQSTAAAQDILDVLSKAVMEIGVILDRLYTASEDSFDEWVELFLPLAPRTAERIRAMWLVHRDHPTDELPEPWKALWSL